MDNSFLNLTFGLFVITIGLIVSIFFIGAELSNHQIPFKITMSVVSTCVLYIFARLYDLENTEILRLICIIYIVQSIICVIYEEYVLSKSYDANTERGERNKRQLFKEILYNVAFASTLLFVSISLTLIFGDIDQKQNPKNTLQYIESALKNSIVFRLQFFVIGLYIFIGCIQLIAYTSTSKRTYTVSNKIRDNQLFIILSNFGNVPLLDIITYLFMFSTAIYLFDSIILKD